MTGERTWKGRSVNGWRVPRRMLRALRRMRRSGCVLRPGSGMRMAMLFTSSTGRVRATWSISWKSECARLWYHQSWPLKQTKGSGSAARLLSPEP